MTQENTFEQAYLIFQTYIETDSEKVEVEMRDAFYRLIDRYNDQMERLHEKEKQDDDKLNINYNLLKG